jgi:hypothetical protein
LSGRKSDSKPKRAAPANAAKTWVFLLRVTYPGLTTECCSSSSAHEPDENEPELKEGAKGTKTVGERKKGDRYGFFVAFFPRALPKDSTVCLGLV